VFSDSQGRQQARSYEAQHTTHNKKATTAATDYWLLVLLGAGAAILINTQATIKEDTSPASAGEQARSKKRRSFLKTVVCVKPKNSSIKQST